MPVPSHLVPFLTLGLALGFGCSDPSFTVADTSDTLDDTLDTTRDTTDTPGLEAATAAPVGL